MRDRGNESRPDVEIPQSRLDERVRHKTGVWRRRMRKSALWPLAVVLGVLAVSCRPAELEETSPTHGDEVGDYLLEMYNLANDLRYQLYDFECSYNEQFSPGLCGVEFVEEGEEFEPLVYTDGELFGQQRGLWLGFFDLHLGHANALEKADVPQGFESAHQDYLDAFRAYFTYLYDQVAASSDLAELEDIFNPIFDPLAEISPRYEQLLLAVVETCRSLEDLGTEAGNDPDLECPSPPPEMMSVEVDVGEWTAVPGSLPAVEGLVVITITNRGSRPIRPVAVEIVEGDPANLPVVDGLVDIALTGTLYSASGHTTFGVVHPGDLFGRDCALFGENCVLPREAPVLQPGESVEAESQGSGPIVVFDYQPGEFESEAYVVIERSEVPG